MTERLEPRIEDVSLGLGFAHEVGEEASFHPEKGDSSLVKATYITGGGKPGQTHQTVCVTVSEQGRKACATCKRPPFCIN